MADVAWVTERAVAVLTPLLGRMGETSGEEREGAKRTLGAVLRAGMHAFLELSPLAWPSVPEATRYDAARGLVVGCYSDAAARAGLDLLECREWLRVVQEAMDGVQQQRRAVGADTGADEARGTDEGPSQAPDESADETYRRALAAWIATHGAELSGGAAEFGEAAARDAADVAVGLMRAGMGPEEAIGAAIREAAQWVTQRRPAEEG